MFTPEVRSGKLSALRARGWELPPQLTSNKVRLYFTYLLFCNCSPRGELILTDTPLFTVPDSAHTDNPEELNRVLSSRVEELSEEDREYFYSLADCKVLDC